MGLKFGAAELEVTELDGGSRPLLDGAGEGGRRAERRPVLGRRRAASQQLGSLWKVEEGGRWI